jgi:SEC-C motif domain protein
VSGFAAAASKGSSHRHHDTNKKKGSSSSTTKTTTAATPTRPKGFGTKTSSSSSWDEMISKFASTKIPTNVSSVICPCQLFQSNHTSYHDCCFPYHHGHVQPETPRKVLQTRYSAFVYRIIPYIIQTTHPINRDYRNNVMIWAKDLNRTGMFDSYEFVGLYDIQQEEHSDQQSRTTDKDKNNKNHHPSNHNEEYITFKVRLRSKETNQETVITERSQFLQTKEGNWLYGRGDVRV